MIAISLQNRRPGTGGPPRAVRSRRRVLHRRGSLLAEVTMSTVLLVIIMGMTVKVLGWVALERRAAERREQAVVEVANLMERLAAHPYDEVTPELARIRGPGQDRTVAARGRPESRHHEEPARRGPIGQTDCDPASLARPRWRMGRSRPPDLLD